MQNINKINCLCFFTSWQIKRAASVTKEMPLCAAYWLFCPFVIDGVALRAQLTGSRRWFVSPEVTCYADYM
jgi:hypothetical protein